MSLEDLALAAMMRKMGSEAKEPKMVTLPNNPDMTTSLKLVAEEYLAQNLFKPGDLVMWKPHCKNRKIPAHNQPMVVVEYLDPPVYCRNGADNAGSNNAYERLDIRLGCIFDDHDDDGAYLATYLFDSRRLMPYNPEAPQVINPETGLAAF